ncbi:unnamed protein product [Brachionus calyciflorus]|uniref:Uncharacterized protein n=1 Tax=Brachionus calyciflorus TaxID=104777 RepID=A0A813SFI4_9BILA|nr:unnamed protein product [Brachionus calyciflorus]
MDYNKDMLINPIDETCYFSALEDIQQDQNTLENQQQQQQQSSLDSENYYTHLHLENMANREYLTIKNLKIENFHYHSNGDEKMIPHIFSSSKEATMLNSQISLEINKSRQEKLRAELSENIFDEKFSPVCTSSKSNLTVRSKNSSSHFSSKISSRNIGPVLNNLTSELIDNFEKKIKRNSKHLDLNQSIDSCLEETQFDDLVDSVIHSVVAKKSKSKEIIASYQDAHETFLDQSFSLFRSFDLDIPVDRLRVFNRKVDILIEAGSKTIGFIANLFKCLLNLDYSGAIKYFRSIPSKDKWNVAKNVLFYAAKLALLFISKFYTTQSELYSSLSQTLNSILNYVKSYEVIRLC